MAPLVSLVVFALLGVAAARSVVLAQSPTVVPPVARVTNEADYAKAMKELQTLDTRLRNNIEEVARADLQRMLLYEATMNARGQAARMEEILAEIVAFWEARKVKTAIEFSRQAMMEAGNVSKALVIIDLESPSTATLAQDRLGKVCESCHAAHRERLPDGSYRIK